MEEVVGRKGLGFGLGLEVGKVCLKRKAGELKETALIYYCPSQKIH